MGNHKGLPLHKLIVFAAKRFAANVC